MNDDSSPSSRRQLARWIIALLLLLALAVRTVNDSSLSLGRDILDESYRRVDQDVRAYLSHAQRLSDLLAELLRQGVFDKRRDRVGIEVSSRDSHTATASRSSQDRIHFFVEFKFHSINSPQRHRGHRETKVFLCGNHEIQTNNSIILSDL